MLAGVFHLAGRRLLRCSDVIDAKPLAKARHQHHLLLRVWRNALAPIIGERTRIFQNAEAYPLLARASFAACL
jgi:hypothetical protein